MEHPVSDSERPLTDAVRVRILEAASALIATGGRDAATTRRVAVAAGVQAPTIYRLFGDKEGLLDAVAEHGLGVYVAAKGALQPNPDPVQELREGWDTHVAFGLAHPALFSIMSGNHDARRLSPRNGGRTRRFEASHQEHCPGRTPSGKRGSSAFADSIRRHRHRAHVAKRV